MGCWSSVSSPESFSSAHNPISSPPFPKYGGLGFGQNYNGGDRWRGRGRALLRSDGSANRTYRLVPPWESRHPQPMVRREAVTSENATSSLLAPSNAGVVIEGESAPPKVEKLTLSMARAGECVASFALVLVASDDDDDKLKLESDSYLTPHINPMEGQTIARFYQNEGSSGKWISSWVYSLSVISQEDIDRVQVLLKSNLEDVKLPLAAFGEEMLDFHAPILQDLPFPPVKINFQKDFFCDGKIGSGTEGKVYKCRSHFIGFDETSVAVKEVLCLDYPQ